MMTSNILAALGREIGLLPDVLRGLLRRGFAARDALRFLAGRVLLPEGGYRDGHGLRTPHGFRLYTRRDFVMYEDLFLLDEYVSRLWGANLARQSAPLVLDLGANLGFFSALCCSLCPSVRLRCFELMPDCAPVITRRLEESGCRDFRVITAAAGRTDGGTATIHYDMPFAATNCVDGAAGRFEATVPRIALDAWLAEQGERGAPFLVKIDVEGAEQDVVRGGAAVLARAAFVLLEVHVTRNVLESFRSTHRLAYDRQTTPSTWVCVLRRKDTV